MVLVVDAAAVVVDALAVLDSSTDAGAGVAPGPTTGLSVQPATRADKISPDT